MAVYLVYRTHDGAPSERHIRQFDHDTVLAWAQHIWAQFPESDEAYDYAEKALHVRELGGVFHYDEDHPSAELPGSMEEVAEFLSDWWAEDSHSGPHHIQIHINFDEYETVLYVFDDSYRAANPGKTDFLLLDGWELPVGESDAPSPELPETSPVEPPGDGEGSLYVVSLFADSKYNIDDLMPADCVEGLRVPDLARYLLTCPADEAEELPFGLQELGKRLVELLRSPEGEDAGFLMAIRDEPDELTHWGVYSDWLQERDLPPAGLHLLDMALRAKQSALGFETRMPERDLVKVTPHMAQACKHRARETDRDWRQRGWEDYYGQFIFFDDRWAAAHPSLAAGILTFASRWDVLA